jgi:hypothetical protein
LYWYDQPLCHFLNKGTGRTLKIYTGTAWNAVDFQIDKIVYSSRSNIDLAILSLPITYKKLREKHGIKPLYPLQKHRPLAGTFVARIGYDGVHGCRINSNVEYIQEGEFFYGESIRYNCYSKKGSSGSPVIDYTLKQIIAIHTTRDYETGKRCESWDNPCELDEEAQIVNEAPRGKRYAISLHLLHHCFNENGHLTLAELCPLLKP